VTQVPDLSPAQESGAPSSVREVPYRGADLDAERGPGLGCFRFQVVVLVALLVLTPVGVAAGWPDWLTTLLLFLTIALLLVAGQTIIFLLRLVAADRRGRRRPLASATRTVGELEDERRTGPVDEKAPVEGAPGGGSSRSRRSRAAPAMEPDGAPAAERPERPERPGRAAPRRRRTGGDDDPAMRQ
jgi:hypothetical protein